MSCRIVLPDLLGDGVDLQPDSPKIGAVFDTEHYAATPWQKMKRCAQLAPRYFLWDLPRYFWHRHASGLSAWDWQVLWNPLRELHPCVTERLELPERYQEALESLRAAGVRLTLPPARAAGLAAAWWATRTVSGDVMECGAYRGATSLLLAMLGRLHEDSRTILILDTFCGVSQTSACDVSRTGREYVPREDQVAILKRQAAALGVLDRIVIHAGLFSDTFARIREKSLQFALVHIDANLYQGTLEACEFVLPRMSSGGIVVFDDYSGVCDLGARLAIDQALVALCLRPTPLAGYSSFVRVDRT